MKITFHGAARTTTGSMHLFESAGHRILLDCGLYQGHRAEALERNANLPFDSKTLSAVLLSHAHIDHCGNLPMLVKRGFAGEINCTTATQDLTKLMLRDSARIQEQDAAYLNYKRARQGLPKIEPLYSTSDTELALRHIVGHSYHQWFKLNGDARAILYDAGHILGSALTVLEATEGARTVRLGFSGDLGRPGAPILRDAEILRGLDYLIVESTYGNREHNSLAEAEEKFVRVVRETLARGGKVVIPSFALERTQALVYALHRHFEAGDLPAVPVYVDSPLAIDVTAVFRVHLDCFDDEIREHILAHDDPFGFGKLHYTRAVEESKKINETPGPAVIISANGMCEAGRILHHLKYNIESAHNTILFVGYQAENTLGRRIVDGVKRIRTFGEDYVVRARVEMIDGFSAHADRSELLSWIAQVQPTLKGIFVVHGEAESSRALADTLRAANPHCNIVVPELHQTIEL
ncbi:MAG: MBL fold metallo-hydrolase [Chloroflexi bacterium]|nr:MBL fold metallo-hydrolase [Chloroflexota bacterium]